MNRGFSTSAFSASVAFSPEQETAMNIPEKMSKLPLIVLVNNFFIMIAIQVEYNRIVVVSSNEQVFLLAYLQR